MQDSSLLQSRPDTRRLWLRAGIAVMIAGLVAVLTGCNGATPTSPLSARSGAIVRTVLASESFELEVGAERVVSLVVPESGTLEVTVDFTNPENDVFVVLTDDSCRSLREAGEACRIRAGGTREGNRGSAVSQTEPGAYKVWVQNLGPDRESVSLTAVLTYEASEDISEPSEGGDKGDAERTPRVPRREPEPERPRRI